MPAAPPPTGPCPRGRRTPLPRAAAGGALALLALAAAAAAQEEDRIPNGRLVTFDTRVGIEASDNPDVDSEDEGRVDAILGLGLRYLEVTPTERFEARSNADLTLSAGGEDGDDTYEVSDPQLFVLYTREPNRDTQLRIDASLRRSEISSLDPIDLVLDGELDAEDVEELLDSDSADEETTRLRFDLGASLATGRAGPLGATYRLGVDGTRIGDEGSGLTSLDEETNLTGGVALRADLTPVLEATADLGFATLDDDEVSLSVDLTRRFATGGIGTGLVLISEEGRSRATLSFGGAIETRRLRVEGSAGVVAIEGGEREVVGNVEAVYDLPLGAMTFDLRRRVSQLDDPEGDLDGLRKLTVATAGWQNSLTPVWSLDVGASYTLIESVLEGTGDETFGRLSASLTRPITRDWTLSLGLSHRFEEDDGGTDESNTVSISLARAFDISF